MYISNFAFRKLRNKVLAFENTIRAAKEIPTSFMDGPQLKKTHTRFKMNLVSWTGLCLSEKSDWFGNLKEF